jgi:hypothetical protein
VSAVINYSYSEKIGLVEKILVSSILDIFLKSYIELKNLFSHVFHIFLTLALGGGEWLASCSGCFMPERVPGMIRQGFVGSKAGLDIEARKIHDPAGG